MHTQTFNFISGSARLNYEADAVGQVGLSVHRAFYGFQPPAPIISTPRIGGFKQKRSHSNFVPQLCQAIRFDSRDALEWKEDVRLHLRHCK